MVHPPVKLHVFPHGQIHIHAHLLQHHADLLLDQHGLPRHVIARHFNAPAGDLRQRGQHANRGGLARAIGAQQAKDFPRLNREGEIIHNGPLVVDFGNVLKGDRRCHTQGLGVRDWGLGIETQCESAFLYVR